jgi:hypothetical protein
MAACSIELVHWSSRCFSPTIGSDDAALGAAFFRARKLPHRNREQTK